MTPGGGLTVTCSSPPGSDRHSAGMRIRFTPERREFFELFSRASSNAVDIARLGKELFERFPEGGDELIGRIKEHEHTGDDLTHEV